MNIDLNFSQQIAHILCQQKILMLNLEFTVL